MSILKEVHEIAVESGVTSETVARLVSFFQLNGYALDSDVLDETNPILLKRGERGAGWYSSEMTALFTELEISIEADVIVLRYTIDVKGQRLTQGDRAYWRREVKSAAAVVQRDAEATDLRPGEKKRVAVELKRFYFNSVMFAVLFVLFILLLILLGIL